MHITLRTLRVLWNRLSVRIRLYNEDAHLRILERFMASRESRLDGLWSRLNIAASGGGA